MAAAQLIDLSNYGTMLVQSTAGRAGTPNGNIFFNTSTGQIEVITREELAQVNLGSGLEDNPLTNQDGITMGALYGFERQERRTDEELRKYDTYFVGSFKFAGAYEVVNGRKFAADDRQKIRNSGWIERASNGAVDRIYFGVVSLGNIEDLSQPYYQLSLGGAPVNFAKDGGINEAVQVYGTTANGDTGAGTIDNLFFLTNKVRTFGFNYDEKGLADSGVNEMSGYSTGFALGESPHLTSGSYSLADVYGGAQVSPWTGMSLEKLAVPVSQGGFNEADGNFTWVLNNTLNGNLDQCVAFLDALAQTDDDSDSGLETITNGKRVATWYTYDAQGRIVTRSGADSLGLFIENLPIADQQSVVFKADNATLKTYPFQVQVNLQVGANAAADANAWYHNFYLDGAAGADYGTPDAVTVNNASAAPVKGSVSSNTTISYAYDYDGNTQAGLAAGIDKDVVALCEGDGGATQAKTVFTISRTAVVNVAVAPGLETNL
jgi:YD repeat-containing protein